MKPLTCTTGKKKNLRKVSTNTHRGQGRVAGLLCEFVMVHQLWAEGGSMRGITCSDGDVRRRCHVMSKAEGGFVCVVV